MGPVEFCAVGIERAAVAQFFAQFVVLVGDSDGIGANHHGDLSQEAWMDARVIESRTDPAIARSCEGVGITMDQPQSSALRNFDRYGGPAVKAVAVERSIQRHII